jgi:hypothetical protein
VAHWSRGTDFSWWPPALLVAQLAYEGKGSPELAYWFERLGKQSTLGG